MASRKTHPNYAGVTLELSYHHVSKIAMQINHELRVKMGLIGL